jgi:hypothetical protein
LLIDLINKRVILSRIQALGHSGVNLRIMAFDLAAPVSMPQLIDRATTSYLVAPDWTINIQICDMCAKSQELSREAVTLIKKKIKDKNTMTSTLALHLLQALMKNWYVFVFPLALVVAAFFSFDRFSHPILSCACWCWTLFLWQLVCDSLCPSEGISEQSGEGPQGQKDQVSHQEPTG